MKLFLDQVGNVTETIRFDGDNCTIQFHGDAQQTLDNNARIRNGFDHRKSRKLGIELIASIDNLIAYTWLVQYGINVHKKEHFPRVVKLLNSREWRLLKTTEETI